jgi:putative spermidine/putrescine transport system ATP-binding protein
MAYLELHNVTKSFAGVLALDDLRLELGAGEFFTLLGPSGCGKTTALRIVAGFESPDVGQVLLEDRDITSVPPNRRDMGMVFQAYSLFPNMTARQNVEFGLKIRNRPASERASRVAELLELVGLGRHGDRYPYQLSGGQQQRVALARALTIEPRVLLLDEPLSALDARVRVQLREEIRRIQTRLGITALYVTHDQEEALSISDRVAVLSVGHVEQVGTPSEIYGAPATPFVAEFVGTMNRLEATVVDGERGIASYAGREVVVDAVRGRRAGERVLVLIRPEAMAVDPLPDGSVPEGSLPGRVAAPVFLGSVTRLKIEADGGGELAADLPSTAASRFQAGTRVAARFTPDIARVLDLPSAG